MVYWVSVPSLTRDDSRLKYALLMIEVFKAQHSLKQTFMNEILVSKNNKTSMLLEMKTFQDPELPLLGKKVFLFLGESCGMNCI